MPENWCTPRYFLPFVACQLSEKVRQRSRSSSRSSPACCCNQGPPAGRDRVLFLPYWESDLLKAATPKALINFANWTNSSQPSETSCRSLLKSVGAVEGRVKYRVCAGSAKAVRPGQSAGSGPRQLGPGRLSVLVGVRTVERSQPALLWRDGGGTALPQGSVHLPETQLRFQAAQVLSCLWAHCYHRVNMCQASRLKFLCSCIFTVEKNLNFNHSL